MSIKVDFIQKKSLKERLWKTLNVVVGVTMILNVSLVGALIAPRPAQATTPPTIDGLLDEAYTFLAGTSTGQIYKAEDASFVYFAVVESRNINDNVYNENDADVTYDGWTNGHTFDKLLKSDRMQLVATDQNFVPKVDVMIDYLFERTQGSGKNKVVVSYDSGICTGLANVGACDQKASSGSGNHTQVGASFVTAATSLDFDINGTSFANRSPIHPSGNTNPRSPFPEDAGWEYRNIYEVRIDKAAFGQAGFGSVSTPFFHNSPAKQGQPDTVIVPGIHKLVNGVESNTANPGDTLTYTISYFNGNSTSPLTNTVMTDVLTGFEREHLTYVPSSCTGGSSC